MHPPAAFGGPVPSVGQRTALILTALVGGIYLGVTTVAEIDPFYRGGAAQMRASSYTTNGWRGADAVPPPAIPVADRMSGFVADAYAFGRSYYDFARDVAPPQGVPGAEAYVTEPVREDWSEQDLDERADYACVGCDEALESDVAIASAAPSGNCGIDDPACSPQPPLSTEESNGSAEPQPGERPN